MINLNKKYRTRNGCDVKLVFATDQVPSQILGYIGDSPVVKAWNQVGYLLMEGGMPSTKDHPYDLVEVKEPKVLKCWVNFYNDYASCFSNKLAADSSAEYVYSTYNTRRTGEAVEVTKVVEDV